VGKGLSIWAVRPLEIQYTGLKALVADQNPAIGTLLAAQYNLIYGNQFTFSRFSSLKGRKAAAKSTLFLFL